ncbi:YqzE family protein [Paenibacillus hamazuiensis]|uniref:YqzE family protein n=1 Tax=Paenibacillus hamazuiensis TaxID=2936508 RepID=UPI00200D90E0
MKGEELVQYITERVVAYFDTPREVRKQARQNQKTVREDWVYRWFGLVPFSLKMWADQQRRRIKEKYKQR